MLDDQVSHYSIDDHFAHYSIIEIRTIARSQVRCLFLFVKGWHTDRAASLELFFFGNFKVGVWGHRLLWVLHLSPQVQDFSKSLHRNPPGIAACFGFCVCQLGFRWAFAVLSQVGFSFRDSAAETVETRLLLSRGKPKWPSPNFQRRPCLNPSKLEAQGGVKES